MNFQFLELNTDITLFQLPDPKITTEQKSYDAQRLKYRHSEPYLNYFFFLLRQWTETQEMFRNTGQNENTIIQKIEKRKYVFTGR